MIRNAPKNIIPAIINNLKKGSTTLTKLSKAIQINRVTVSQYLDAFQESGMIIKQQNGRETILGLKRYDDSYFELPIKQEDKQVMQTIYTIIRRYCLEVYKKEPSKTQVYKIIYELNKEEKLNLPIGWYQHGPCAVLVYQGNETESNSLNFTGRIKEKVQEYCKLEPIKLQKLIYKKYNNRLYQIKEKIKSANDEDINYLSMELIKLVPLETIDITTDFVRATMHLGWKEMQEIFFNHVWKYISAVNYRESLRSYYGNNITGTLNDKIHEWKEESESLINDKMMEHMDAKYSQDKLYQRWVKKKK